MSITPWIERDPFWLDETVPIDEVVVSTRYRLARNIADKIFPGCSGLDSKREVKDAAFEALAAYHEFEGIWDDELLLEKAGIEKSDRSTDSLRLFELLKERNLVSTAFSQERQGNCVALSADGRLSAMVNEEDHFRLQLLLPGDSLSIKEFKPLRKLEEFLGSKLDFAFDSQFGYLTSCITNFGTGLRASVMVHLPALNWHRPLDLKRLGKEMPDVEVRGIFGEGSQTLADFVQLSNRYTLGETCESYIYQLRSRVDQIINLELSARDALMTTHSHQVESSVEESMSRLKSTRFLSSKDATRHLSKVRFGCCLGLYPWLPRQFVLKLLVRTRPVHLQLFASRILPAVRRDRWRAKFIQDRLQCISEEGRSDLFP